MTADFPARYWHPLADGKLQCDLCPRCCRLADGQRGFCFVRQRQGSQMMLTTYGRSSGFCIDPIEKKPLNQFLPGTPILSFGTAGCNLGCRFCQNWDLSRAKENDRCLAQASPEQIVEAAARHHCRSVAFTYNEPIIFLEYAVDTAKACHQRGIRTVAVTAGYIQREPAREFYAEMDAANVDLKSFRDEFYRQHCQARLAPILDGLIYLRRETKVWVELTTLLIPGENDSPAELDEMTRWVVHELGPDVPMHFTAFHPDFELLGHPPTPPATLFRARQIAMANGVRYAYTGNIHDDAGQATYCHQCKKLLIARNWYVLSDWHLDAAGRCAYCGTPCAGVFDAAPGDWGGRRQPVQI